MDGQGMRNGARSTRALRGGLSSLVAVTIAATSHTLAGGAAPAWWLIIAVSALAAPVTVGLVGRRPSLRGTVSAVAAAQVALHAAFAAVGDGSPVVGPPGPAGHTDHAASVAGVLASAGGGHVHLDPAMILAHLCAAVLTVFLLAHGEQVVRRAARGVRRLLSAQLPVPPPGWVVQISAHPRRDHRSAAFLSALSRRGPPALAH